MQVKVAIALTHPKVAIALKGRLIDLVCYTLNEAKLHNFTILDILKRKKIHQTGNQKVPKGGFLLALAPIRDLVALGLIIYRLQRKKSKKIDLPYRTGLRINFRQEPSLKDGSPSHQILLQSR